MACKYFTAYKSDHATAKDKMDFTKFTADRVWVEIQDSNISEFTKVCIYIHRWIQIISYEMREWRDRQFNQQLCPNSKSHLPEMR